MTDAWRTIKHARLSSLPTRRHRWTSRMARAFPFRPWLEFMEDRTLLSTFMVSNTGDSGPGSLRQAILDSNSAVGATNTIDFDISGSGVQTIAPLSPLPAITNPVLIDGDSQPGYAGTPLIELSGSQAGSGDGLTITGAGCHRPRPGHQQLLAKVPASTSRAPARPATGSTATSWGPTRPARRPSPTKTGVEIDGGASGQPHRNQWRRRQRCGRAEPAQRQLVFGRVDLRPRHRMATSSRAT